MQEKLKQESELPQILTLIVRQVKQNEIYRQIIQKVEESYIIKHLRLSQISPSQITSFCQNKLKTIKKTQFQGLSQKKACAWLVNQCKMFSWVLFCYSHVSSIPLEAMTQKDFELLHCAFPYKQKSFLIYYIHGLISKTYSENIKWSSNEKSLLSKTIACFGDSFKWSDVSFKLFLLSDYKYYRSPHKCREMWSNHMDQKVKKQKWTNDEDLILFQSVLELGTKWSKISKKIDSTRTEHMVKNRYNAIYKKYQKKFNRLSSKALLQKIIKILQEKNRKIQNSKQKKNIRNIPVEKYDINQKIMDFEQLQKSSQFMNQKFQTNQLVFGSQKSMEELYTQKVQIIESFQQSMKLPYTQIFTIDQIGSILENSANSDSDKIEKMPLISFFEIQRDAQKCCQKKHQPFDLLNQLNNSSNFLDQLIF